MKKNLFLFVLGLMILSSYSSAVSMKDLKKFQVNLKNACPPEAGCDENGMEQPDVVAVEKILGVKGLCRSGGTASCSTKDDKLCEKSEFGEECVPPSGCIVIIGGIGKDTCSTKTQVKKCYDGTKEIWWDGGLNTEAPAGVDFVSRLECLYVIPLSEKGKSASAHFSCRNGSCKTNGNAVVFVHFGCFEGVCTANGMDVYQKGK